MKHPGGQVAQQIVPRTVQIVPQTAQRVLLTAAKVVAQTVSLIPIIHRIRHPEHLGQGTENGFHIENGSLKRCACRSSRAY